MIRYLILPILTDIPDLWAPTAGLLVKPVFDTSNDDDIMAFI